jgi:hypothetical protein
LDSDSVGLSGPKQLGLSLGLGLSGPKQIGLFLGLGLSGPKQIGLFLGLGLSGPKRIGLFLGLGLSGPKQIGIFLGLGLSGPRPDRTRKFAPLKSDSGSDSDSVRFLFCPRKKHQSRTSPRSGAHSRIGGSAEAESLVGQELSFGKGLDGLLDALAVEEGGGFGGLACCKCGGWRMTY